MRLGRKKEEEEGRNKSASQSVSTLFSGTAWSDSLELDTGLSTSFVVVSPR